MTQCGAVAIGKNEGERLKACLASLEGVVSPIVYVDSGSTDGSVAHARSVGAIVVELDTSVPFTAARARNAGFERLLQEAPSVAYVQFIDGDCVLSDDWVETARAFLDSHEAAAVVCGRRRERHPGASVYNYLCDVEWDTPIGETDACGGDAMMQADAFRGVNGFVPTLIAGEEPELCVRLRQAGWKIHRIDTEMTMHDAAMMRFSQWWKRSERAGHAFAEGADLHGGSPERHWVKESRRVALWGIVLPSAVFLTSIVSSRLAALVLLAYPLNLARIALRLRAQGRTRPWTIALFMMLGKFPEAVGWLRYLRRRARGEQPELIEYK